MGAVSMIPEFQNAKSLMEAVAKAIEKEFAKKGFNATVKPQGTYLVITLGKEEIRRMVENAVPFQFFEVEGEVRIKVKVM